MQTSCVALVVDDEPLVLDLLCSLVKMAGFAPVAADDGVRALELCGNGSPPPSVIITDINMPRLDGIELVRMLRMRWAALPAVFVTGNPHWSSRTRSLGEVLEKPFTVEMLLGAIRRAVLNTALEAAMSQTGAPMGNLQILDSGSMTLRIQAHRGFDQHFLSFFKEVRHEESACGSALRNRSTIVIEDVRTSPVYTPASRRAMLDASALACLSTPILNGSNEVLGMLSTHYRAPRSFSPEELQPIEEIAARMGMVLELLRCVAA
jgi:CheY-like chemotaxis protein